MESRVNKYFFIDYFTAAAVRLSPGTFLYQERSPVIQKNRIAPVFSAAYRAYKTFLNISQT